MNTTMKELILGFLTGLVILSVLMLMGCTTPERIVSVATWGPGGTTSTLAFSRETGMQLWIGERDDTMAGPGTLATSKIGKATTEGTILGLAGLAAGAMSGSAPLALLGGAGGAVGGTMLENSTAKTTTSTAAMLAPVLAPLVAGKTSIQAPSAVTAPSAATVTKSAVTGQALPLMGLSGPSLAGAIKNYVHLHPEVCRLRGSMTEDEFNALADQVIGGINPIMSVPQAPLGNMVPVLTRAK